MIAVMNRIPVNSEHAEAFEARFSDRAALVDGMPGFVSFRLLRPTKEGDPYVVMTFWESREHFQAWTESDEFKKGHAQSGQLPRDAFRGHPTLEVMEIILDAQKGEIVPAGPATADG
jgi:heme-degrading monooxygenase HmoA